MPSNHLILCCPLLLQPSIFPSIRVFANESALRIRWPKYWSFSCSISLSSEQSGLISFRIELVWPWCPRDSIFFSSTTVQKHQFFCTQPFLWSNSHIMVQLSHLYMTTGKTIAFTIWIFVGKVMSLLFNILSRLDIVLPRSKCLNFMAAVTVGSDCGAQENKVYHCFHCFPVYLPWSDGTWCHDLSFFECWALGQLFHSPLSLSSRGSLYFFAFCHKGGVICISEVIDISPSNLDSSLCFIQSGKSHDVLCI